MAVTEITRTRELVYELRAADVMERKIITIAPDAPMGELREMLRDNRISGVPVIDKGRLVGIVSVEDFIDWLADGARDHTIADRMTSEVTTVYEDEALVRVVDKLEQSGYGRLPVITRKTGKLTGLITKHNVIAGLLKKLDIDYRRTEMARARSGHVFEDLVADRTSMLLEYDVPGGDFARAGASATGLKTTLLRLGVSPPTARRTAIVTYEAEMNLVFFTDGGKILARVDPDMIKLEVTDDGPGIADIDQAMQPGYSTAPEWVRELGFGAGMGLHNIRTCADRMDIKSKVGEGTRLDIEILLEPKE